MSKNRNSTIELLRIISMMGVLGLHYLNKSIGGGLNTTLPSNIIVSHFLESLCIVSVNVFVLISGFFMIRQRTTGLKKAIDLYGTMVFYNLLLFGLSVAFGKYSFSWKNLAIAVCPFVVGNKWFLEAYILLLLFVPFINTLIGQLNKESHLFFISIWLCIFSVWSSFLPSPPVTDKGYGISNFISLYLLSSYIRKYVVFSDKKRTRIVSLSIFFVCIGLICISSFSIFKNRAWGYNYLFNIIASVSVFIFFLNLPETNSKWVNVVAGTTFGVYIIHANVYFQKEIYTGLMHTERFVNRPLMAIHFLLCIQIQFMICSLIDLLRQLWWDRSVGRAIRTSAVLKAENEWEEKIFR